MSEMCKMAFHFLLFNYFQLLSLDKFLCFLGYDDPAAALKVLYHLPFPYSVLSAFMVIPKPLRDAVYDYVAKRRYDWFGKDGGDCLVLQDKELLDRFIDAEELLRRNRSACSVNRLGMHAFSWPDFDPPRYMGVNL
ncbi:unnamed protein product [Cuscuta campestris]|uniref:Uncharacterized protein n=1 Tax=Cuscuta campestris TaxID=132261 RepID=A0A484N410_9ASTE|nr:unnamed protein product [Cuscuta campestris]